jgi:arginase family enzyme
MVKCLVLVSDYLIHGVSIILTPSSGGHLHDGGVVLNIYKNNDIVCASHAKYESGGGHSHGRTVIEKRQANGPAPIGGEHIKEMTTCSGLGPVKKTDQIWIDADYDFNKHSKPSSF